MADNLESNSAPERPEESLSEENQRALHLVQALVSDSLRMTISSRTQEILQFVAQRFAVQSASTNIPASNDVLTVDSSGGGGGSQHAKYWAVATDGCLVRHPSDVFGACCNKWQ